MDVHAIHSGCAIVKKKEAILMAIDPGTGGSAFRVYVGGDWYSYVTEPSWAATSMTWGKDSDTDWVIVACSAQGETWQLNPTTKVETEGTIAPGVSGITNLVHAHGSVWACGMGRIVYQRNTDGTWTDRSAPKATLEEGVIGFTAMAGMPDGSLLAVGWQGEAWSYRDGTWTKLDTGTKAGFNAVSVRADGEVVIVGDGGAMLVGRPGAWELLEMDELDLFGVAHFGDEVFVTSTLELFMFRDNALVPEERFANDDGPATAVRLVTCPESCVMLGENDVFRFADGVWTRLF